MNSLCALATDWRGDMPRDGCIAQVKVDGWRALWFRGRDGVSRLWSRNGMPLEGVDHITHRLRQMEREAGEAMFFDAEFQVDGTLAATKHWCETGWKRGGNAGKLFLFDCMTFKEWQRGGTDRPLYQRRATLEALLGATGEDWDWRPGSRGADDPTAIQTVPETWVFDVAHVMSEVSRVWATGGEGIMLKDPMAGYQRKRSSAWLKVKVENMHKWNRRAA